MSNPPPPGKPGGQKDKPGDSKSAKGPAPRLSSTDAKIRRNIEASIEFAEEEHRRELFRRRIDLARSGVRNYQMKRLGEAVKAFHTYLRILEDWKGVPEGGLHPSLFDLKSEIPELLLISGVYWDLVKLYDRTQSAGRKKDFTHYLGKYIIFSKGMPYQSLASETLRKYISNEKPIHRDEFKNAYKMITGSSCFVATALLDVSAPGTIEVLRGFRDEVLARSRAGRAFIGWYYRHGPSLARATDRLPGPGRRLLGRGLNAASAVIRAFRRGPA